MWIFSLACFGGCEESDFLGYAVAVCSLPLEYLSIAINFELFKPSWNLEGIDHAVYHAVGSDMRSSAAPLVALQRSLRSMHRIGDLC